MRSIYCDSEICFQQKIYKVILCLINADVIFIIVYTIKNKINKMTERQNLLPKWILIITGIFSLLEIMVSIALCIAPESVVETVDLNAKGVDYLIYMWAARQFALGFIFGFATFKKSIPMLTIAYIFFLVMFVGDFFIGISQKHNSLIIGALVMCIISSALIFAINRRK